MSILRNINFIKELQRIPCGQPSPLIIIETAFQAAPPALLSLFLPDCNDIVKTRAGRSPWHARSISGFIKTVIKGDPIGINKILYKVGYDRAEQFLWYWLVADVTTEFITTWQTLIYQEQQCQLPGAGTAYGRFGPLIYSEGFPAFTLWDPLQTRTGVAFGVGRVTISPGYEATVAYSMNFQGWPDPAISSPVTTWWEEVDVGVRMDEQTIYPRDDGSMDVQGGSWYKADPGAIVGKVYRIGVEVLGPAHMQLVNSSFNISLMGRRQGNTTWGCHPKPVEWPFPNPFS